MATKTILTALQADLARAVERQRDLGNRLRLEHQQAQGELGRLRASVGELLATVAQYAGRSVVEGEGEARVVHAPAQTLAALQAARGFSRELGDQLAKASVLADHVALRLWLDVEAGALTSALPSAGANPADAAAANATARPARTFESARAEYASRVEQWERLHGQLEGVNAEIGALEEKVQRASEKLAAEEAAAAAWLATVSAPELLPALEFKADESVVDGLRASRIRIGARAKALRAGLAEGPRENAEALARAAGVLDSCATSLTQLLAVATKLLAGLKDDAIVRSVKRLRALAKSGRLAEESGLPEVAEQLRKRAKDVRLYEDAIAQCRALVASAAQAQAVRVGGKVKPAPKTEKKQERKQEAPGKGAPPAPAGGGVAPKDGRSGGVVGTGTKSGAGPSVKQAPPVVAPKPAAKKPALVPAAAPVDPLLSFLDARAAKANRRASLSEQFSKSRELEDREDRLSRQIARIEQAAQAARPLASKSTTRIQTALARLDAGLALAGSDARRPRVQGQRAVGLAMGELAAAAGAMGLRSSPTVRQLQSAVQERRDAIARVAMGLDPNGPVTADQAAMFEALGDEVPGLARLVRPERGTAVRGRARGGGRLGGGQAGRVGALSKAYESRDRKAALNALHPGAGTTAGALEKQVDAMIADLRIRGYPVRRKSWFSSALSSVTSVAKSAVSSGLGAINSAKSAVRSGLGAVSGTVSGGLAALKQTASTGLSFVKQTAATGLAAAKGAGQSALAAASKLRAGALEKVRQAKQSALALAQQAKSGALSLVQAAKSGALERLHDAKAGFSWLKGKAAQTAKALSSGASWMSGKLGDAAASAWDLSKQGVRAVGNAAVGAWKATKDGLGTAWTMAKSGAGTAWNAYTGAWKYGFGLAKGLGSALWGGAKHLYQATGNTLSGAWKSATGVVGAGLSGIKKGLSWVGDKIGQGAKKLGGVLLMHPGINAMWQVAKAAGPHIASFGKAAWEGAKTLGGKAANFLQSPAGQLLTTGLSIAATFIPGGLLVKAGIGAIMGAVEAVAKGGGLKEALMGAAIGGLEGALPLMKLKTVGKLALGGVKGGLTSAMNGGSFGDIAKGALGGAFEVGGLGVLKKFGGGRGVKMLGNFMSGATKSGGVLGKLQKITQSGVVQKAWGWGQKLAPKAVKGAVWLYDKSGKVQKVLKGAHTAGEYVQHALSGVSGLSAWGAEKLGDGWGKDALTKISGWAGVGAEKLEGGLEKLETAEKWADTVHKRLGQGLKLIGVNPKKAVKELHERERQGRLKRELQRKHAEKLGKKPGLFDRTLNVFEGAADSYGKKKGALSEAASAQMRKFKQGLGKTEFGQALFKGGEKMVKAGLWAKGNLTVVEEIVGKGTDAGEKIQKALQNVVLATEGAADDQWGGSALKWINESAGKLQGDLETGLKYAKQVQGITHVTNSALGGALKLGGASSKEIEANDKKWKTWGGFEKLEDKDGKKQKRGFGAPGEVDADGKVGSAWWAVAGEKYSDAKDGLYGKLDKAFDKVKGSNAEEDRKRTGLSELDRWRAEQKRRYQKRLKEIASHGTPMGDENAVGSSRWRAMMRLAGQGDQKQKEDEKLLDEAIGATTHSQKKDWKAYEARQKKAAESAAAPASVSKELGDELGPKLDSVMKKEAQEVQEAEDAAHRKGGGSKHAGKPANAEVQAIYGAVVDLQVAKADLEAAERAAAQKTGAPPRPSVHAAEYARATALLARVDHLSKLYGLDLSNLRDQLSALAAYFNAGQPVEAKSTDSLKKEAPAGTPASAPVALGALGSGTPAAEPAPETKPGKAAPAESQALSEVATSALDQLSTEDGVVGAPKATPANGLAQIEYGSGVTDPFAMPEPVFFDRLRGMVLAAELRIAAELPVARALGEAGDLVKGDQIFKVLRREVQALEVEYDRLRNAGFTDPAVGDALARYAARILGIRAQLEGPAEGEEPAEVDATTPVPAADDDAPADDPVMELLATAGEAIGDWIDRKLGTGPKKKAEPDQDESYAGESVTDTWIGSGGSTRPIGEGLSSNFRFDDAVPEGPSVANELAGLGGALLGLGQSVAGAGSDLGGLGGELGGLGKVAGGLGGQVGELLGGSKENAVTKASGQLGEFSSWLKKGAGKVGGAGGKLAAAGGQIHGFGDAWRTKGLGKAVGKMFRKGRPGTAAKDEGPAPVVDPAPYEDSAQRLDGDVLGNMERFLGGRLGDVKIHTGRGAEYITKRFDAEAVTIRDHVFFAPGRYQPQTTEGRKLIAHELTHVMQRSRPNLDTQTAEEEAHRAEAAYGTPGMETLDLSQPQADFRVDLGGAEHNPTGVKTAKKTRSVTTGSGGFDQAVEGEELLDLVGERVYELLVEDLEEEHESR